VTADPRVARLRSLDTEATQPPWRLDDDGFIVEPLFGAVPFDERDAALVAAMRNAWPAMVTLLELVLAAHITVIRESSLGILTFRCGACGFSVKNSAARCATAQAALAVLDTLEEP
jgi:hypothetical protein